MAKRSNTSRRVIAIILCALMLFAILFAAVRSAFAQECFCSSAEEHAANAARLESILRTYRTVGASIVFIKQGKIVDVYHFGRAIRADSVPVTDDTLFRVG